MELLKISSVEQNVYRADPWNPISVRKTSSEYRQEALECFRRFDRADDASSRLHWLVLAEAWLQLAELAKRSERQGSVAAPIFRQPDQDRARQ
jgi:hypothetical protein